MFTRPPVVALNPTDLDYDSKLVWELFVHNKNSTLEYGWIRNRVMRSNGKITNDRQNAAIDYLESKDLIEKVSHGRWRYKKPVRPSAPVVASAPVTEEEAAQVIPRFPGAMTDLVYSLLREKLPEGLITPEIHTALGIDNKKDAMNCAASLAGLERQGWVDADRTRPKRIVWKARATNKMGKPATDLRHASVIAAQQAAQAPPVKQVEIPALAAASSPAPAATPPAPQQARVFTLEQVRHYGELKAARAKLQAEIDAFYAARLVRIREIDAELREVYGEG